MKCRECLEELATGSLRDLQVDSPVMQHCAICPDCGPLATALRDREYTAATVLNSLPPMSNPITIAETAGVISRRRRLGKIAVFATGAALVATVWTSIFLTATGQRMFNIDGLPNLHTETIALTCLSPDQAGDLIGPYLRENGSLYYVSKSGVRAITIRGSRKELATARQMIGEFEGNDPVACDWNRKFNDMQGALKRAGFGDAATGGGRSADMVPNPVVDPNPVVEPTPVPVPNPANPPNPSRKR